MRLGTALVISAPSGTGKSTLCRKLLAEFPNLAFSVSCATREKRHGEVDGVDYFFIGKEEFEKRIRLGHFAEWAQVHDNFYGTPLAPLFARLRAGKDVLLDVDARGARNIKKSLPDAKFVFILPPSMSELERRLRGRGQDDEKSIRKRLANAIGEIRQAEWYDDIIINDNLDQAYADLRAVYVEACLATPRNMWLVEKLLAEKADS